MLTLRFGVLGSITRLHPRVGSFDKALSYFRAASFRACIEELAQLGDSQASFLRARAALRLGLATEALKSINRIEFYNPRERGEAELLRAVALRRLGETEDAESALRDAAIYSISAAEPVLAIEIEVFEGLFALGRGEFDQALAAFERGLGVCVSPWIASPSNGIVPRDHVIARIQELIGVVHAATGHYSEIVNFARASLSTLDKCAIKDVYQEAYAIRNLSILARDFDLEQECIPLTSRTTTLPYTSEISSICFTTLEALAWGSALRGDTFSALRLIRRAESVAESVPEQVILGTDRATLARDAGHHAMVAEEIEHAIVIASSFDWNAASGDSREALLALAQAASPLDSKNARTLLDRYVSITRSMDIAYAARIEPRARAEEDYTHGVVLRSEGRLGASMERLESAFRIWDSIGYAWRAGRAALELAELDAGEVFRLAVRRELNRRPESPFAKRARLVA